MRDKEGTNQIDHVEIKKPALCKTLLIDQDTGEKIFTAYVSAKTMFPRYTGTIET